MDLREKLQQRLLDRIRKLKQSANDMEVRAHALNRGKGCYKDKRLAQRYWEWANVARTQAEKYEELLHRNYSAKAG